MTLDQLKNALLLSGLFSITLTAEAGSFATAITTISANIVPAASFAVSDTVLLRQPASKSVDTYHGNTINMKPGDRVSLSSSKPAKLLINSSQNLVYDVSMPATVSITGNENNISTHLDYTPRENGQQAPNEDVLLEIGGELTNDNNPDAGTYQGLVDITINYN